MQRRVPTIVVMTKNLSSAVWVGIFVSVAWAAVPATQTSSLPVEVLLDKGYRQMYNMDFIAAHATFAEFEHANPPTPWDPFPMPPLTSSPNSIGSTSCDPIT